MKKIFFFWLFAFAGRMRSSSSLMWFNRLNVVGYIRVLRWVFDFVNKLSIPSFLNTLNCPFWVFDLPQKNRIKRNPKSFGYLIELPGHNHEGTGVLFAVI